MQTNREDLYMRDNHLSTPSSKFNRYRSNQEDIYNSEMSIDFSDSNLPKGRNLTSQLQTAKEDYTEITANFNMKLLCDNQNVDMENCCTQASSLDSSQTITRESSTGSCTEQNSFSAKFRAPMKQPNSRKYRLMRGFDKEVISAKDFLNKLNETEKRSEGFTSLPDRDDDMSLEQHLEALSNKYTKQELNPQNQNSFSEDLQMKIIPKTCFGKGMQIILQNKKTYYQKVKKGTTHICVTLPATITQADLLKHSSIFRVSKTKPQTCFEFFTKLGRDFCEKGVSLSIKVNEEPIFPAKTTLEYLCMLYQDSDAKIKPSH